MKIVADCHLHIYPAYRLDGALRTCSEALHRIAREKGASVSVGLLAERGDCHLFGELASGGRRVIGDDTVRIEPSAESLSLSVNFEDGGILYIIAGRQVATEERLEVLGLAWDGDIPDGRPVREVIEEIRLSGGIPVLSWAPGKWLFGRGKVVRGVIDRAIRGSLLVGDTSLRPGGLPEPALMRRARRRGLSVIAGSDPLPAPREERMMGRYASVIDGCFDEGKPVTSIRTILGDPGLLAESAGKRCGVIEVAGRLYRYYRSPSGPRTGRI